jgi:hypothetical protein
MFQGQRTFSLYLERERITTAVKDSYNFICLCKKRELDPERFQKIRTDRN